LLGAAEFDPRDDQHRAPSAMPIQLNAIRPTRNVSPPKIPVAQPSKVAMEAARRIFFARIRAAASCAKCSGDNPGGSGAAKRDKQTAGSAAWHRHGGHNFLIGIPYRQHGSGPRSWHGFSTRAIAIQCTG
jgi:hypothetical protein